MSYTITKDFNKLFSKEFSKNLDIDLDKLGEATVKSLEKHTPVRTGKTANSYSYEIKDNTLIIDSSARTDDGHLIPALLHFGHATRNGGYVPGTYYIKDALDDVWKLDGL